MNRKPITLDDMVVPGDATIADAMACIDATGMEVAFVCDGDLLLRELVTDGDIRRALLAGAAITHPLRGVGSRDFTSCAPTTARAEALEIMLDRAINCLPVVDEDGVLIDLHTLRGSMLTQRCDSWAVVMAGGLGTRLGELTQGMPKPMLPIGDKPILEHIVRHLVSHGIRRIFLSVNYLGTMIEDHFGDGRRFHCQIDYLREDRPLGTGGALGLLPQRPGHPLLVMNGDLMTRLNIQRFLAFHRAGGFAATMAIRTHEVTVPFGVAEVEDAVVQRLIEKPKLTYQINAGIYCLDPELLTRIPTDRLFPITELLNDVVGSSRRIGAYHMQEPWMDVGLPHEFQKAQQEV